MNGFYVSSRMFFAAQKCVETAIEELENNITTVSGLEGFRCSYQCLDKIDYVSDNLTQLNKEVNSVLETTESLKSELAKLDIGFSLLSSAAYLGDEVNGDSLIAHFDGYDAYYKILDGIEVLTGVLYTNNNLYLDASDPNKITYKRYDPNTDTYKNISIFDDENLSSFQFGANQGAFNPDNFNNLIDDDYIWNRMQEYYPVSSFNSPLEAMTFYERYFSVIEATGCGYAAAANVIFSEYEGREDEFEKTFGYPMYTVKDGEINFNYEYFELDYFNYNYAGKYTIEQIENGINVRNSLEDIIKPNAKSTSACLQNVDNFVKDNYEIDMKAKRSMNYFTRDEIFVYTDKKIHSKYEKNDYIVYGGSGWDLYNMDGSLYIDNGGGHYMMIVDYTSDGKPVVSSWGEKFVADFNDNDRENSEYNIYSLNF